MHCNLNDTIVQHGHDTIVQHGHVIDELLTSEERNKKIK